MVTDEQVRRLRKLSHTEKNQESAESKAGMDPTTARRYLGLERLPSELKKERSWRTREDPFCEVWDAVQREIQESPGLEAKTLFEWLQREYLIMVRQNRMSPALFTLGPEGKRTLERAGDHPVIIERRPPVQLEHLI